MQKGKAVFFGIVMILVNFCIAVCIRYHYPALCRRKVWQKPMENLKMPIF